MKPEISLPYALKALAYTALFNTLIAVFLTVLRFGNSLFWTNFTFSQSIGLSICTCLLLSHKLIRPARPLLQFFLHVGGMLMGSVIGIFLGTMLSGLDPNIYFERYGLFIQMIFFGLMFGSIISYFFMSRERLADSEARIQEERIKRLTSEKKAVEANLRLLQAQMEPHFLFNTLSNILSLLDTDPGKGKSMLVDLVRYLRTSLAKTREKTTTLGHEMEMIKAYLNIFKGRMGDRLNWHIDFPDAATDIPFPPMLIQPIVENAIRHGLEPKIDGGEVSIKVELEDHLVRVEVSDTGVGLNVAGETGLGLSNIKERLQALYEDGAGLILEENRPSGLKAVIEISDTENLKGQG